MIISLLCSALLWILVFTNLSRTCTHACTDYKASILDWARQDFAAIVRFVEQEYRPSETVLIGNSVGVHLVALSSMEINSKISRILSVSGNNAYLGYWPWNTMFLMTLVNFYLLRRLSTFVCGYYPAKTLWMGQLMDLPTGIINDWSWFMRHRHYFADGKGRMLREAQEGLRSFKGHMLSLCFTDDTFATFTSFSSLFDLFKNAKSGSQLRYMNVPKDSNSRINVGHVGFFKRGVHDKTGLWDVAKDFVMTGKMPKAQPGSLRLRGSISGDAHSITRSKL